MKRIMISLICLIALTGCNSTTYELDGKEVNNEDYIAGLEDKLEKTTNKLTETNEKLDESNKKLDEAKPYFEMKEVDQKKLEEKAEKAKKEEKEKVEQEKKEAEAKKNSKIGETISYEKDSGITMDLTINSVEMTSERNQFADSVNNVVAITYTIENTSDEKMSFFLDNNAQFYNSDDIQEDTYPNGADGVLDLAPGKKGTSTLYIGLTNEDNYLECQIGDEVYMWSNIK